MAAVTVSLEWLLAQHDLGLRLVAGVPAREQLTWVHASDLVDPTPWLTGGELVLTIGIGLPRAVGEQRAYVGRLADAGVAGLGFGVGVRYAASNPERAPARQLIDEPCTGTVRRGPGAASSREHFA
jgi:purine catabolism regulator